MIDLSKIATSEHNYGRQFWDLCGLAIQGYLVELSWIPWHVEVDICKWDVRFSCRFGPMKSQRVDYFVELPRDQEAIEADVVEFLKEFAARIYRHWRDTRTKRIIG